MSVSARATPILLAVIAVEVLGVGLAIVAAERRHARRRGVVQFPPARDLRRRRRPTSHRDRGAA